MTDLSEAVLLRDRVSPSLYRGAGDLNRAATGAADQMVMVSGRAATVRRLTVAGSDGVEIACVAHQLQGSVDRGQADAFAVMSKIIVDLLRRSEVVLIRQNLRDGGSLPSAALRAGPARRLSAHRSDQHVRHVDGLHG